MLENRMVMTDLHEVREEARLNHLPKCAWCDAPIVTPTAVHHRGKWICDGCLDYWRESVEEGW